MKTTEIPAFLSYLKERLLRSGIDIENLKKDFAGDFVGSFESLDCALANIPVLSDSEHLPEERFIDGYEAYSDENSTCHIFKHF